MVSFPWPSVPVYIFRSVNRDRVIKSRKLRWAGHVARMAEGRSTGKSRRRREDNIKMDLEKIDINAGN